MRVLVGCEQFGKVREAFRRRGHDAWSCDIVPTRDTSKYHIQGDILALLYQRLGTYQQVPREWDLFIAFPDCTYVAGSGLHWNKRRPGRAEKTEAAIDFVRQLLAAPVPRIALENPIGCLSTRIRKPDQIIHPWQFGDDASKATCIWLVNLPLLLPTNILPGGRKARRANQTPSGQNKLGPSPERSMLRAETYPGIANAMAEQWGVAPPSQKEKP